MNYVLFMFFIIFIFGIKYRNNKDDYMSKEQTTAIKGIFAIIILLSHFRSYISISPDSFYSKIFIIISQLMVTMFFFYSGYGIIKSIINKKNYMKTFFKKRFIKTLLNLDFAVLIFILVNWLLNIKYPIITTLLAFTGYTDIGNSNWFIFVTLVLYLIVLVSYTLFKKNKKIIISSVFILSSILIFVLYLFKESWWYNTILCFPLGMFYGEFEKTINKKVLKDYSMLSFIILSVILIILNYFSSNIVVYLIYSCIFTLLIVNMTYILKVGNKILDYFGKFSFYIYVYQRISYIIFKDVFSSNVVYFFISLFFTILLSIIIKYENDCFNKFLIDGIKVHSTQSLKERFNKLIHSFYMSIRFRNYILFESNPDYADNTYYVYDELLRQGYNKKYKFIWIVKDPNAFDDINIHNVRFIKRDNNEKQVDYYKRTARFIIDCNRYINKENTYQFRFHLGHGMPIKIVKDYTSAVGSYDKYLLSSKYFTNYFIENGNIDENKMEYIGLPRCDQFYKEKESFDEIKGYDKVILWMPTYRNHQSKDINKKLKLKYGIPSISNEKELIDLNILLKNNNALLIIKFHPAENMKFLENLSLSNIMFTKNELFDGNHKNIYHLCQLTDALITDYSSIYYDYMMQDKPIGMAIEDIEEYKKYFPICFDNIEEDLPAEYIYSYNDLIKFIKNVLDSKDIKRRLRNKKREVYFKYVDGNASKRVVEVLKRNNL